MNTTTKHTPGPWEWKTSPEDDGFFAGDELLSKSGIVVLDYTHWSTGMAFNTDLGQGEEVSANARLIAAAPELLEALESFVKVHEFLGHADCPHYQDAKRAIAKARGEA